MESSVLFVAAVLFCVGQSSQATFNNSSLSLVLADQCATTEELQTEIQAQNNHLESQIKAELQAEINQLRIEMRNEIKSIGRQVRDLFTLGSFQNPAQSCRNIQPWQRSAIYWIQNNLTGTPTQQYCDMTRTCCGRTGGWMQVANLDMTDSSQNCPSGFRLITSPRRMCGRYNTNCASATIPVHGVEYSRVCGRVIGYQYSTTNGFLSYHRNRALTIDSNYVDGISITHSHNPRKHIWTFASVLDEHDHHIRHKCPCTHTDRTFPGTIPPFVGNDYFCETGSRDKFTDRWYLEDPLWNGQGCGSISTCCSFNNPPWFCKQLPQATRDDIEVRICADEDASNEDVTVESIELYIQ